MNTYRYLLRYKGLEFVDKYYDITNVYSNKQILLENVKSVKQGRMYRNMLLTVRKAEKVPIGIGVTPTEYRKRDIWKTDKSEFINPINIFTFAFDICVSF